MESPSYQPRVDRSQREDKGADEGSPGGAGGGRAPKRTVKRGTLTRVACESCRRSKIKCDGLRPACSNCSSRVRVCSYEMEDEERLLTFIRTDRRVKGKENEALWSIVRRLQDANESAAMTMFRRMRTSSNILDLAYQLEAAEALAGPSGRTLFSASSDISGESEPAPQAAGLNAPHSASSIEGEFSEIRFASAGRLAQDYISEHTAEQMRTNADVSAHDEWQEIWAHWARVQELLGIYFKWQHGLFECFPESAFHEDMRDNRGDYYSPCLVYAILATASLMCETPIAPDECVLHRNRGLRLLYESHSPSLANIAAASLLSHVEESLGNMSSMWLVSGRMMRMSIDMGLHSRDDKKFKPRSNRPKAQMSGFWGAFITDSIVSLTLARVPSIPLEAIMIPLPEVSAEEDSRPWHEGGLPRLGMRTSSFRQLVLLALLINSTLRLFFAPRHQMSAVLIVEEHNKYLNWFKHLPPGISNILNGPPYVLCLHMQYHSAVLLLYRPFLAARFIDHPRYSPREVTKAAATAVSDAFAEHLRQYQASGICTFQVHCLLNACTIHLLNLKDDQALRHITAACNSFRTLSTRIAWAAAALHIIKGLAEKWRVSMPEQLKTALHGATGVLPHFEFTRTQTESFMAEKDMVAAMATLPQAQSWPMGSSFQQTNDRLFSPFPYQQMPLLSLPGDNPSPAEFAKSSGLTSFIAPEPAGMEMMSEDWLAGLASQSWDTTTSNT